jgi:hypothetical protein
VIPQTFTPNVEGFKATPEQFADQGEYRESQHRRPSCRQGFLAMVSTCAGDPPRGVKVDYKIAAS